jgi:hypothetical protein
MGEIPAGIADLEAGKMPIATGHLKAIALDDDGAVAPALGATVRFGEGELESCTVRTRPYHVGAGSAGVVLLSGVGAKPPPNGV